MSWLLFLDESGHDHRNSPYEVRGGIALDATRLWPFVRALQSLEVRCFGDNLHRFGKEVKGHKLLDKDRFKWAAQGPRMDEAARRLHCLSFLNKGIQKKSTQVAPTRDEFTAYGQACLEMVHGILELLRGHDAKLFASAIPATIQRLQDPHIEEFCVKTLCICLSGISTSWRVNPNQVYWLWMNQKRQRIGDL